MNFSSKLELLGKKAESLTTSQFISYLKKSGFKTLCGRKYVFFHKKRGIVCKIGGIICGPKPKKACPTIIIPKEDIPERMWVSGSPPDEMSSVIRIQPLLETHAKARKKIYSFVCGDRCENRSLYGRDVHEENVGVLNGKILVFDW